MPISFVSGYGPGKSPGLHLPDTQKIWKQTASLGKL